MLHVLALPVSTAGVRGRLQSVTQPGHKLNLDMNAPLS